MNLRFEKRFRPAITRVRSRLEGADRLLFDFMCAAGLLGWRLPDDDIKLKAASGTKDPRKRLALEFPHLFSSEGEVFDSKTWARAGKRLARLLVKELDVRDISEDDRSLRVLLAYVTIALAPDCVIPLHPLSRAAWDTASHVFASLLPSTVKSLGVLQCVQSRLASLRREAAAGLRIGRLASGRKPGREGCNLAVDPQLVGLVGKALGKELVPGYMARLLFYTKPGDHIWPHPDDPKFAVTVLVCILHEPPPDGSTASAFLAYPLDGSIKRYPLHPGSVLAVEPGMIHAREPVRPGERVALLSIGLRLRPQESEMAA